jgi:hypothetical protein
MNFKGRITSISDVKKGTSKTGTEYATIEFVLNDEAQYPQTAVFKMLKTGDNTKHVDNFVKYNKVGDVIDLDFNLKVNEYNGKFYQELSVYKVINDKRESNFNGVKNSNVANPEIPSEEESDLPF